MDSGASLICACMFPNFSRQHNRRKRLAMMRETISMPIGKNGQDVDLNINCDLDWHLLLPGFAVKAGIDK